MKDRFIFSPLSPLCVYNLYVLLKLCKSEQTEMDLPLEYSSPRSTLRKILRGNKAIYSSSDLCRTSNGVGVERINARAINFISPSVSGLRYLFCIVCDPKLLVLAVNSWPLSQHKGESPMCCFT